MIEEIVPENRPESIGFLRVELVKEIAIKLLFSFQEIHKIVRKIRFINLAISHRNKHKSSR